MANPQLSEPFSPETFVCDSSLHRNEVVEHTTSWLTINPTIGCPLGCAYCFREHWEAPNQPYLAIKPDRAVADLIHHTEFVPGITPIAINVSSTDALLPSVKPATFECLRILDNAGLTNIVGLISKCGLTDSDLTFLCGLQHLRLIFFVSYAAIPPEIEPVPVQPRLDALRRLKQAGIATVVYFRPIVPGWNDTEEQMERVLTAGNENAGSIVYGGLHQSPEIHRALLRRGIDIPYDENTQFHLKAIDPRVEARLLETSGRLNIRIPLYKHTSCAISHAFGIQNYNHLYRNADHNCSVSCPSCQQTRCQTASKRS